MPYRTDARLSGRHPFELFTLTLILLVSLPVVVGLAARPGSIAAILPPPAGLLWSITLTVGAASALAGVFWRNRARGLIIEQFGLGLVGLACAVYGAAVELSNQQGTHIALGMLLGLAGASFWRYVQIQRLLNRVKLHVDTTVATREAMHRG